VRFLALKLEKEEIAVLVRAIPEKKKKDREGHPVGIIGINKNRELLRLYPLGFRYGEGLINFRKNDLLEISTGKPEHDLRWESRKILRYDHLQKSVKEREIKDFILPLSTSIEKLNKQGASLGIVKPEILNFEIKVNCVKAFDRQEYFNLLGDFLERGDKAKIPIEVRYIFRCKDEKACRGHKVILLDWDSNENIRNIIRSKQEPAAVEKEIKEYISGFVKEKELYFIVGTHFTYGTWMIVGIFCPGKNFRNQSELSGFLKPASQNKYRQAS
jgi:hypothetical protein